MTIRDDRRMTRRAWIFLGAIALAAGSLTAALVLGLRRKSPRARTTVRRVNRAFFNPLQMRSAGNPGAYASVIRHIGRSSGRAYETPVHPAATNGGFVIALPYGPDADWCKNVRSAGSAILVHEGVMHRVDQPEIVPMEAVANAFSVGDQRAHRMVGVDECLRVRRVAG
jgi:hypothetical protein